MSESSTASSKKMLFAMTLIGTVCAILIVLAYEGTKPRIERLKAEALDRAIFKVIPGISTTEAFYYTDGQLKKETESENIVYSGYDENGNLKGVAISAVGQGYADKIKVLYGYNPNEETIVGIYVLETKETPGLGDKIEKDENFLANFKALDVSLDADFIGLVNDVVTVKNGEKNETWQIDGITGATISSRAIGNILNSSANEWAPIIQKNLETLKAKGHE
ncbi:MAG: RnfABCDGE type electron transport complex subunit G [Bacteroidia bacterium]